MLRPNIQTAHTYSGEVYSRPSDDVINKFFTHQFSNSKIYAKYMKPETSGTSQTIGA